MIEFARPLALLGLVLPLALWWFARHAAAPRSHSSGIHDWWPPTPAAARAGSRRRTPVWARWLVVALAAAIGALAEPHASRPAGVWRIVIDTQAALELPVRAGGPTRLDAALQECEAWLATLPADTEVHWIDTTGAAARTRAGDPLRREWPARARRGEVLRALDAYDAPHTVWLVARTPTPPPRHAAWFASGGAAVSGPIASGMQDGRRVRWVYDGANVHSEPDLSPARVLQIDAAVPARLAELARLWAAQRGFLTGEAQRPAGRLRVERAALRASVPAVPAARVTERAGRDGWQAELSGALSFATTSARSAEWPLARADGSALACVRYGDGEVELAFDALAEPDGDPAAFALSWSRLFDASWLGDADEYSIEQRSAPGDGVDRLPLATLDAERRADPRLSALLGFGAACAALGCAHAWSRRAGGSSAAA
jgi:hypothetical protein